MGNHNRKRGFQQTKAADRYDGVQQQKRVTADFQLRQIPSHVISLFSSGGESCPRPNATRQNQRSFQQTKAADRYDGVQQQKRVTADSAALRSGEGKTHRPKIARTQRGRISGHSLLLLHPIIAICCFCLLKPPLSGQDEGTESQGGWRHEEVARDRNQDQTNDQGWEITTENQRSLASVAAPHHSDLLLLSAETPSFGCDFPSYRPKKKGKSREMVSDVVGMR
jgi:hypothetical protein